MLLIYSLKNTQRITYVFKHICTRILGVEVKFTSIIEEFISHAGPKLSYGKIPLGNEMFIQSAGLLIQQGFESIEIVVKEWEETKCFFYVGKTSALPFDIFSASFYLLTRYEEYLPHVKDEKGRFLASESLAYKKEFLQHPVIDIWAYKFKELLAVTFPNQVFPDQKPKTHTLINAKEPFVYKNKGFLRSFYGYVKDISKFNIRNVLRRTSTLFGIKNDPCDTFDWIINELKATTSKTTFFFLIGEAIHFEKGINSQRKVFKILLKNVADYMEVGLIFSKESLNNLNSLKNEKEQVETIVNRNLISSLNDDYLVNLPENYRNLIELEVEKDFTMVYEDVPGFRASTCTPYLFYDLDYEIVTPLMIHPIAATIKSLKSINRKKRGLVFKSLFDEVHQVNGCFSVLFSNKDFSLTKENEVWRSVFVDLINNRIR